LAFARILPIIRQWLKQESLHHDRTCAEAQRALFLDELSLTVPACGQEQDAASFVPAADEMNEDVHRVGLDGQVAGSSSEVHVELLDDVGSAAPRYVLTLLISLCRVEMKMTMVIALTFRLQT